MTLSLHVNTSNYSKLLAKKKTPPRDDICLQAGHQVYVNEVRPKRDLMNLI